MIMMVIGILMPRKPAYTLMIAGGPVPKKQRSANFLCKALYHFDLSLHPWVWHAVILVRAKLRE